MVNARSGNGHGEAPKCGAKKHQGGGTCTQPAGWGTDHPGIGKCKFHGGSTPTHVRAAEIEIARRECDRLGIPIETSAEDALIRAVWEAEGNLAFYRAQVQALDSVTTAEFGISVKGDVVVVGEKTHPLVVLYHEAERWRANVAASALKANVDERRVRLAERDAAMVIAAQIAALTKMGLGKRLEEFRAAFVHALGEPAAIGAAGAARPEGRGPLEPPTQAGPSRRTGR